MRRKALILVLFMSLAILGGCDTDTSPNYQGEPRPTFPVKNPSCKNGRTPAMSTYGSESAVICRHDWTATDVARLTDWQLNTPDIKALREMTANVESSGFNMAPWLPRQLGPVVKVCSVNTPVTLELDRFVAISVGKPLPSAGVFALEDQPVVIKDKVEVVQLDARECTTLLVNFSSTTSRGVGDVYALAYVDHKMVPQGDVILLTFPTAKSVGKGRIDSEGLYF